MLSYRDIENKIKNPQKAADFIHSTSKEKLIVIKQEENSFIEILEHLETEKKQVVSLINSYVIKKLKDNDDDEIVLVLYFNNKKPFKEHSLTDVLKYLVQDRFFCDPKRIAKFVFQQIVIVLDDNYYDD